MQSQQYFSRVEYVPLAAIKPSQINARMHSAEQEKAVAKSMKKFGWIVPLLVDENLNLISGHCRHAAAKRLHITEAPVLRISHLSQEECEAFAIADNRLAEAGASWSNDRLASSFLKLGKLGWDLTVTGFDLAAIDMIVTNVDDSSPKALEKADDLPAMQPNAVSRSGDLWMFGDRHSLLCGDAKDPRSLDRLMWGQKADVLFTDPPYNLPTNFISGKGQAQHSDFHEGSGEMEAAEFLRFLTTTLSNSAYCCRDGAIAFTFMDWRHMGEMIQAGTRVFGPLKQLCVWGKTAAGMGTFYRSQHELVFVWKVGSAPNINNFKLGQGGRHRTNLWTYAGGNTFHADRMDELKMHPTVKPVALIADALRDVTNRGDIVLDPFGGSGSTLIAAEKTGRCARLIEIDPLYCDAAIRRFQKLTGKLVRLSGGQKTFDEVARGREQLNATEEA